MTKQVVNLEMVNCALLVVILILVVFCCLRNNNEGFRSCSDCENIGFQPSRKVCMEKLCGLNGHIQPPNGNNNIPHNGNLTPQIGNTPQPPTGSGPPNGPMGGAPRFP
jgi:hypothetical protein